MSKEYNIFMDKYEEEHQCCPKCGSESYATTYMGYILDMNNKESYKDENRCTCSDCGNVHITHNRKPKQRR